MNDSLRETFFAECEDLLDSLGEGLAAMAEGDADGETVNSIFRAVHSIKGAAGAFALEDLVAFAHRFETVLDRIRSGTLEPDETVLRVITRSGDVLAELVEAAQTESGAIPEARDVLLGSLAELSGETAEPAAESDAAFTFEPIAAIALDLDLPGGERRFTVQFRPDRALYDNGHDPLNFLRRLAERWSCEVSCDTSAIPDLGAFDPDESYLAWTVTVAGDATEADIRRVFAFAEGLCTLDITEEAEALPPLAEVPGPPPAEPDPPSARKGTAAATPRATLRVDPDRVDRLINTVGELIINQAGIAQKARAYGIPANSEIMTELDEYRTLAREIQEAVMAIRAQPVKPLFQRMGRIVREAGEATGKAVTLVTEGEGTEVDKTLVERLADPLTHMVRNAVDHGIEPEETRHVAGKPARGTVKLTAAHRSGHVLIEISDDGAGLDRERILASAISKGLVARDAKLSDAEIDNLLFMPGFSTAAEVTNLSGRGVGMDVVKTAITALGGRVSITSRPGEGSTFSISLPLTLAVLDGMVVDVCGQTMVLPLANIVETIRPRPGDLRPLGSSGHVLAIRGNYIPVLSLGAILGMEDGPFDPADQTLVLIQTDGSPPVALSVAAISDQRQVVIKSLESNYGAIPGISAATILGDGHIALIVDADAVVSMASPPPAAGFPRDEESDDVRHAAVG